LKPHSGIRFAFRERFGDVKNEISPQPDAGTIERNEPCSPAFHGYEDTVFVPQIVNALLSRHNFYSLLVFCEQAKGADFCAAAAISWTRKLPVMAGC